jgi:hypothetical protein
MQLSLYTVDLAKCDCSLTPSLLLNANFEYPHRFSCVMLPMLASRAVVSGSIPCRVNLDY